MSEDFRVYEDDENGQIYKRGNFNDKNYASVALYTMEHENRANTFQLFISTKKQRKLYKSPWFLEIDDLSKDICNNENVAEITELLKQIKGNPVIDQLSTQLDMDTERQKKELNISKLATLRKKITHNIDETFGTNLEEKKLAKPLKKIEKAVSDKLFGKVKE